MRIFLLLTMTACLAFAGCSADKPARVKFLAFTDTHVASGEDLGRFRDFLHSARRFDIEFAVVLGDIVGHQPEYLEGVRLVAQRAGLPVYLLPGNHDDNYARNSAWWTSVFDTPYYRFNHGGYHFIMNWSQDRDAPLDWLEAALDSIPSGEPVVFCQHYPPSHSGAPDEGPWPLLASRSPDIVAALSGHTHRRKSDSVGALRSETLDNCPMDGTNDGHYYLITLEDAEIESIEEFPLDGLVFDTPDNAPPTLGIDNDSSYFVIDSNTEIIGTASDDAGLESVQWSVDGGEWRGADGGERWSVPLDPAQLDPGHHLLRVRAVDDAGMTSLGFATAILHGPEPRQPSNTVVLSQGFDGYSGCRDVTVMGHAPQAANDGADLDCWVYGPDGSQEFSEFYISFDLRGVRPPSGKRVKSVRLELFCNRQNSLSPEDGDDLYRVGLVNEPWDETITFATRPDTPGWMPSYSGDVSAATGEWPVPAGMQEIRPEVMLTVPLDQFAEEVQAWFQQPQRNHGWVISPLREDYNISFRSSEYDIPTMRPRLVIEFE